MLDTTTPAGQHAEQRLRSDIIGWLTTVSADGRPYTVPVWFLWENGTILVFSQPKKQKVRNLRQNQHVSLVLDGTKDGGDVVIVEGDAELLENPDPNSIIPAYVAKYGPLMQSMNWSPENMLADYSQGIRITPHKIRHWN